MKIVIILIKNYKNDSNPFFKFADKLQKVGVQGVKIIYRWLLINFEIKPKNDS